MNYVIFGHKRHGKDTACEFLERRFGLSFSASSWHACQTFLFDQLKDELGYATAEECFEDRDNHRSVWYEAIREYNRPDRTRMGREIFAYNFIYCGIRDRDEFYALSRAELIDLAIWVDAPDRKPPEDSDSMNLSKADADVIVDNNGSLMQLYERLDSLFLALGHEPEVSFERAANPELYPEEVEADFEEIAQGGETNRRGWLGRLGGSGLANALRKVFG